MSRQREYDQRGYAQAANRGGYSGRPTRGQSASRPLYDNQHDSRRNDQWRGYEGDRQRDYADRWADDWQAQSEGERNQPGYGYYGRDDDGNAYDELPDGGRGVYTHDYDDHEQPYRQENIGARTREHDREFIEAVYGPHREKIMPRDYHRQGGQGYGRAPISSSEGAPYMQHQSERQPGYGRSEIISNNWSQTRGEWDHQNWGNQYDADRYRDANAQRSPEGSYRGKGPKGYERSDERLKELVCERLTDAPSIDASDITVEVKNHEVILTGTVTNRAAKHLAEDLAESVGGIADIINQLKISANPQVGTQSGATSQSSAQPSLVKAQSQMDKPKTM